MEAFHSIHMATMVFTITRPNHIRPMRLASLLNRLGFTSSLGGPRLGTATLADTRGQMNYRVILVSQRGVQPTLMLDVDVMTIQSGLSTTNPTTTMKIARDTDAGLARNITMNLNRTIVPAHVDRHECHSQPICHPSATHVLLIFDQCSTSLSLFNQIFLFPFQWTICSDTQQLLLLRPSLETRTDTHIAARRRRRHPLYLNCLLKLRNFTRIIANLEDGESCQGARCLLRMV